MKKLLLSFSLLFGAAIALHAQDSTSTQPTQDQTEQYRSDDMSQDQEDKEKKEISVAELPAAVQDQLQSQSYTGWAVEKAYTKEKDGQTIYAVELKQGTETKKVKFDAMGNVLKEKDKEDKDQ